MASGQATIRRPAVLVSRAEDHVLHPGTIQVEAVASSVNHTMVETFDGSTRADVVLTGGGGKKEFPDGREGIRRVPIARGLPLLLGRLAQACVDAALCKIGSIADLLIGVGGIPHARYCPMLDYDVGVRLHRVLNDRLRRS